MGTFTGNSKVVAYDRGLREFGYKKLMLETKSWLGDLQWVTVKHRTGADFISDSSIQDSHLTPAAANFLNRYFRLFYKDKKLPSLLPDKVTNYIYYTNKFSKV